MQEPSAQSQPGETRLKFQYKCHAPWGTKTHENDVLFSRSGSIVTCEPVLGQYFLECPDAWRHVLKLDPYQQSEFSDMKNTVPAASKDDDLVPGLLQELAPPPLPTHRLSLQLCLLTRQPVRRRQGKH